MTAGTGTSTPALPSGRLRAAAVSVRPARHAEADRVGAARRPRRPVDRHALRPAAAGRARRAGQQRNGAVVPGEHRLVGAARGRASVDRASLRHRRAGGAHRCDGRDEGVRHHAAAVDAPAQPRHATRCCIRRWRTRATRWARSWPAAGRSRSPRCPTVGSISSRSRRTTSIGRCCCGSTARTIRPAHSTISTPRRRGDARHGVPVFSDECYVEFTWAGRPRTILEGGFRRGRGRAFAVEAIEPRRSAGRLLCGRRRTRHVSPGGPQARRDDGARARPRPPVSRRSTTMPTSTVQRERYRTRLELLAGVLGEWSGSPVPLPDGAFYLWIPVDDGWAYTERLARAGGALLSPGEFYGDGGRSFVRAAVVQPDDRIQLVADRLRSVR